MPEAQRSAISSWGLLQGLLRGCTDSGDCELLERSSSCDKSVCVAECGERVDMISLVAQDELGLAHLDALCVEAVLHHQFFDQLADVVLGMALASGWLWYARVTLNISVQLFLERAHGLHRDTNL